MNNQCEHIFELDLKTDEVRCTKCGDLDDEMQLPIAEDPIKEMHDRVNKDLETQTNME